MRQTPLPRPSNDTLLSPALGILVSLADLWTIVAAVVAADDRTVPAHTDEAYRAAVARVRAALGDWTPHGR